jgi:uncharacterized protein (TIGR04255 family)
MNNIARRRYQKSLVIEVLCEIKFNQIENSNINKAFQDKVKVEYPIYEEGKLLTLNRKQNSEGKLEVPQLEEKQAFQFVNESETQFIQLTDDILTFNDTNLPYRGFENFVDKLFLSVEAFIELSKPRNFERIELRYINKFEMKPSKKFDPNRLSDYLNYVPTLDDTLANINLRFQVKPFYNEHFLFVSVIQVPSSNEDDGEDKVEYLLDIQNILLQHNVANRDIIKDIIIKAHENIGRAFEKFVTDKLRNVLMEVKDDTCNW